MATRKPSTKAAVLEETEVEETTTDEPTTKQIINAGIDKAVEALGADGGHHRYKVIRAVAFQAFSNAIEDGTFDDLVDEAVKNSDDLPAGWGLERSVAAEKPAPKAKATPASKPAAAKKAPAANATPAKPAARKRPTR